MALSTAQMARMNRLLDEALDLDEAGRRRWLEALREEDRDLEGALRAALLPSDQPTLATLPKLPQDLSTEPSFQAGARVGPYELERQVGRGGMAQVWLARRADGAYEREVALKLPVALHLRGDIAKRFARERDILAGLEHPGIARFYDAGIGSDGLPYFAMEYVAGQSLTSWCDGQRLGIADRLKLFLQVLDAVQYAHERGVLHRDIKPSNVLVTDDGEVRLLDFGVARMFQHTDTALTMEYGRALTPEYASPEQMREGELNAASDVYSLGILLYELLCGARPYRLEGGQLPAQLPAVEKPSTRVDAEAASSRMQTPPRLTHTLRGDLDAIVLKALAPEPGQRYNSAQAMAEDLQRYLQRRPVLARPATLPYRSGKFLLRNRTAAVAAAFGLTVAALGLGHAYTLQERRTAPALTVSDKSIAVLPFVDMSEHHDQEYFSDGLSEELIDRLSHSADLRVIARTSSFSFKGKNQDVRAIAERLGVANLLEGSVRKEGDELRITAQLIRASDGTHLWSQTYDRNISSVFKVQDEIAEMVAQSLRVALHSLAIGRAGSHQPNEQAYNLVLKGNYFLNRGGDEDYEKALALYTEATRLDPSYALAWSKVARATDKTSSAGLATARAALHRSLQLEPDLADAHWVLGRIHMRQELDWVAAKTELERAAELNPDDLLIKADLAYLTGGIVGRFNRRLKYLRQIVANDPLDSDSHYYLAYDLYLAGQYSEASEEFKKIIQLNPAFPSAHALRGINLLFARQLQEALDEVEKEPCEYCRLWGIAVVQWELEHRAESDAVLQQLEKKYPTLDPGDIAEARAYRGELDEAFKWLERARREKSYPMPILLTDPFLRQLHRDPRFKALVVGLGLDEWERRVGAKSLQAMNSRD